MRRSVKFLVGFMATIWLASPGAAVECGTCADCAQPEDTKVCGCSITGSGEVGVGTAVGDIGEIVSMPVSIIANSEIDAFTIDLQFPNTTLRYDSTKAGPLAADFAFFAASPVGGGIAVRFGGFGGTASIESGESGDLAILYFTVIEAGCGEFCILNLLDDLVSYTPCGGGGSTSAPAVSVSSWGHLKSQYRRTDGR